MSLRHFEDASVGEERDCGTYTVSEAEIVEFGRRYDPQGMHVGRDAAEGSPVGELIASGWHTCALTMFQFVEGHLWQYAVVGALGIENLRWYQSVRPGETLHVTSEIVNKEEWDDSRGAVDFHVVTTVDGETVADRTDNVLVSRR